MASFKFSINVEPRDIPFLDDAHKRDCADAITASVNSTLKYTLIMAGAVMAAFAVYSFFGFTWMLRMHTMLPKVSAIVPLFAVIIFIFEFISGTMKGWALALQLFFHVVMIFASVTTFPTLIVLPFAIYGGVLHFKLITLLPWHNVISVQPGYPEFTPLPEKRRPSDKKDEDSGTAEDQTDEKKSETVENQTDEKKSDTVENQPDEKKSETVKNQPDEKKSETVKNRPDEKKSETVENQPDEKKSEIAEDQTDEKKSETAEDQPDEKKSETVKNQPDEKKSETVENQPTEKKPSGGNGKKKQKRRKKK